MKQNTIPNSRGNELYNKQGAFHMDCIGVHTRTQRLCLRPVVEVAERNMSAVENPTPYSILRVPTKHEFKILGLRLKAHCCILKGSVHPNHRKTFSLSPLVVSLHTEGFGFICPDSEISVSRISVSTSIKWRRMKLQFVVALKNDIWKNASE